MTYGNNKNSHLVSSVQIPSQADVSVVEFEHLWNKQSAEELPLYKRSEHQNLELNCKPANFPLGPKGQPVCNQLIKVWSVH